MGIGKPQLNKQGAATWLSWQPAARFPTVELWHSTVSAGSSGFGLGST